jgi:hypothetical protein
MEIQVQVVDEQEAYLVKLGLQDEDTKTFVKVCAALRKLEDDNDNTRRKQVLHAVCCLFGCDK